MSQVQIWLCGSYFQNFLCVLPRPPSFFLYLFLFRSLLRLKFLHSPSRKKTNQHPVFWSFHASVPDTVQYKSIGMGKVFHPGGPSGDDDKKYSWSPEGLPYYHCKRSSLALVPVSLGCLFRFYFFPFFPHLRNHWLFQSKPWPKGITIGLNPNFETWRAIFKRFFLAESLSKIKCFSIFLGRLYHFKVPKRWK